MIMMINNEEYNVSKTVKHCPRTKLYNGGKKLEKFYVNAIDYENIYHEHVLVGPDNSIFESLTDACEYYGYPVHGVYNRISVKNWDLNKALTKPFVKRICPVTDPFTGKQFSSFALMLQFYGISLTTYNIEFKKCNDMKEAMKRSLTEHRHFAACSKEGFIDPTDGEEMESIRECCIKHGITVSNYYKRVERDNYSPERALSTPLTRLGYVKDDLGNIYANEAEMCEYYEISISHYRYYIKKHSRKISEIIDNAKKENLTVKEYCKKHY